MNRTETTALLSALLERDVLSGKHWAREVKYVPLGQFTTAGRVDFMAFKAADGNNPCEMSVQRGEFTAYEVKSCVDDYRSGHGLNYIGDSNYLVMPMALYREIGMELPQDVGVYVPLPYYVGRATTEQIYAEHQAPSQLTEDAAAWKLCKVRPSMKLAIRRHATAELLFAMLKAGR